DAVVGIEVESPLEYGQSPREGACRPRPYVLHQDGACLRAVGPPQLAAMDAVIRIEIQLAVQLRGPPGGRAAQAGPDVPQEDRPRLRPVAAPDLLSVDAVVRQEIELVLEHGERLCAPDRLHPRGPGRCPVAHPQLAVIRIECEEEDPPR